MVNILTVPVDAFTNIFLAGLVVAISQKGGKWLVLLVVAYELIRWLRLKMFKMSLKGKRVLITGGGSGLGRNMALLAAKKGAEVILWDVNEAGLEKVKGEIGGTCSTYVVDVTNRELVYDVAKKVGGIDVLVNNAGIVTGKVFGEAEDRLMEKTVQVNTISHFWTCRAFLPDMVAKKQGTIVSIASQAGCCGVTGLADYCASKFGAVGFAEALRMEMYSKKTGVNVLTVNPFYIDTGMFEGAKSKTFLLPMLKEDHVAARVISAVESKEAVVNLPSTCNALPLTRFLPISLYHLTHSILGVSSSMTEFKGRAAK
eukprot:TRINITY_DN2632_c0_g2_i1.p1 TRINITY_DN2632_c0_g2~~TRINITY_DN2632_c0_g2_i1.p1  ORF type:complete len:327 (+),score=132.85 TRINITY_DN2632_c0_g2_i1:42-983(+)